MGRKKKRGRKRKQSLYQKPKHKYLSKIVSFENPTKAFSSVRKLRSEYTKSKTKAKRLRIARATQYAGNRAKANLNKKGLSTKERNEMRQIAGIYKDQAKSFWFRYNRQYGK